MIEQPIIYKSAANSVSQNWKVLDTCTKNGVKCEWSGSYVGNYGNGIYTGLKFSWNIDWSELRNRGVARLTGRIMVHSQSLFSPFQIDIDTTKVQQTFDKTVVFDSPQYSNNYGISFEYNLIPCRIPPPEKVSYDEMFLPSDMNNAILVIEGKRVHVKKEFLSYHSDYFRVLFSSNFKEGQMDEIPIKDISYEDFGLLMSTIYPKTVYPHDETVEKLLELSDRYQIPAVIGHVQYHLLYNSYISSEKMMWMADAYRIPKLFEKCLREMTSLEKVKELKASPEYKKLSKTAKSKVLEHIIQFV